MSNINYDSKKISFSFNDDNVCTEFGKILLNNNLKSFWNLYNHKLSHGIGDKYRALFSTACQNITLASAFRMKHKQSKYNYSDFWRSKGENLIQNLAKIQNVSEFTLNNQIKKTLVQLDGISSFALGRAALNCILNPIGNKSLLSITENLKNKFDTDENKKSKPWTHGETSFFSSRSSSPELFFNLIEKFKNNDFSNFEKDINFFCALNAKIKATGDANLLNIQKQWIKKGTNVECNNLFTFFGIENNIEILNLIVDNFKKSDDGFSFYCFDRPTVLINSLLNCKTEEEVNFLYNFDNTIYNATEKTPFCFYLKICGKDELANKYAKEIINEIDTSFKYEMPKKSLDDFKLNKCSNFLNDRHSALKKISFDKLFANLLSDKTKPTKKLKV